MVKKKTPVVKHIASRSVHVLSETKNQIFEKITTLALGAFGLVAALAWNDAIQSIFQTYFGPQQGVMAKLYYALTVTVIVVLITLWIGRIAHKNDQKK